MLLEDDIRLVAGLHGWKIALHRLHPENPVYSVILYWRRRRHCLGLLGELQRLSMEELTALILSYAEETEPRHDNEECSRRHHSSLRTGGSSNAERTHVSRKGE